MKLHDLFSMKLLRDPKKAPVWKENPEINGIYFDSRAVKPGGLFFAYQGFVSDGKAYIEDAFRRGAVAAVVDSLDGLSEGQREKSIVALDPRAAMGIAAKNFYGNPTRKMQVFGVTGTNGKTSTCFILKEILAAAGKKVALLGTVECSYPGRRFAPEHTTMEAPEIQAFLAEALAAGVDTAVLEVSSHALSLKRVHGVEFDAALFTNLAEDHQDFYSGMEPYYLAKRELFFDYQPPKESKKHLVMATNMDDSFGERLAKELGPEATTFSLSRPASLNGSKISIGATGLGGEIVTAKGDKISVRSKLAGTGFNRENILAATAIAYATGVEGDAIARGIAALQQVPGRLARVETTLGFQVFVDFAHSGPKLRSVLGALRSICQGRLIAVFGAGGDKDPLRRTSMGEAAADLADITVITTDNPRSEDPLKIIAAIEGAYTKRIKLNKKNGTYVVVPDRAKAIREALQIADKNDIVCLAGKGHEDGQIVKGVTTPFNDAKIAETILRERENV